MANKLSVRDLKSNDIQTRNKLLDGIDCSAAFQHLKDKDLIKSTLGEILCADVNGMKNPKTGEVYASDKSIPLIKALIMEYMKHLFENPGELKLTDTAKVMGELNVDTTVALTASDTFGCIAINDTDTEPKKR